MDWMVRIFLFVCLMMSFKMDSLSFSFVNVFRVGFINFKFYVIIGYGIYEVIKGKNFCKRGWCVRISLMS